MYTRSGQLESTRSDTCTGTRNKDKEQDETPILAAGRLDTISIMGESVGRSYWRVRRAIYLGTPTIYASQDRNRVRLVNNGRSYMYMGYGVNMAMGSAE